MDEVSVVIVTYKSTDVVRNAILSVIYDSSVKNCFIVDNNSADNIAALVASINSPKIVLIQNAENLGFGVANNVALNQITTPYALLLNPDAEMDEGAVDMLLDSAKRYPNAGILTPLLYGAEGKVQECYRRDFLSREDNEGIFIEPAGDMCADFLLGAVMLFNMEIMQKIGFFDPKIFLFFEDDDICLNVKRHGYELVLIPTARAKHSWGGSSGSSNAINYLKQYHMAWSRLFLYEKCIGKWNAKRRASKLVFISTIKVFVFFILQKSAKLQIAYAKFNGGFDYLLGRRR